MYWLNIVAGHFYTSYEHTCCHWRLLGMREVWSARDGFNEKKRIYLSKVWWKKVYIQHLHIMTSLEGLQHRPPTADLISALFFPSIVHVMTTGFSSYNFRRFFTTFCVHQVFLKVQRHFFFWYRSLVLSGGCLRNHSLL